jgi:hypothetical protein
MPLRRWIALFIVLILRSTGALAQESPTAQEEYEHTIVFELGWDGEWSRSEGFQPTGSTFAVEITPIEHWLELEIGVTGVRSNGV